MKDADALFAPGQFEGVKSLVHLGLLWFAGAATLYNGVAWFVRREPHLAVNVLVYGALTGFEGMQIFRHLQRGPPA